ncbi:MAG: ATP-dependent helicase [Myxococcota bacterium]|jgi:DNA helicase-2/ATP-dependent DNA helicase PcrA
MRGGRRYVLKTPSCTGRAIDFSAELNDEQLQAVTSPPGPVLCIAGAGTGKTRVVTYRVGWLLQNGADPASILLCTFTNKAAREMLGRVETLSGVSGRSIMGGTFHHIANVILRQNAEMIGHTARFGILDDGDSEDLISSVMGASAAGVIMPRPALLKTIFGLSANTGETIEDTVLSAFPALSRHIEMIKRTGDRYEQRKRELNVMDFDGMLVNLKSLLENNAALRETLSAIYRHILVDEYQDTTRVQGDIVALLCSTGHDVMAVGDDAQSIYSFRGATMRNMLEFPGRHPGCSVVTLKRNYRSTPQVTDLANVILERNRAQYKKALESTRPDGPLPVLVPARDGDEQAAFVAQRITELVDEGTAFRNIAVLYRAHSHSLEVQVALARLGLPYIVRSGARFFEQAHIKDVLSLLRFCANPSDELAVIRLLKLFPGIGPATAGTISASLRIAGAAMPDAAADPAFRPISVRGRAERGWLKFQEVLKGALAQGVRGDAAAMLSAFIKDHYKENLESRFPDAQARSEDLEQLASFAARFGTLDRFMAEISLLTNLEVDRPGMDGGDDDGFITLSSVHQAKGLEWGVVFVLWLADGRFPAAPAIKTIEGEEEERRLFYVAVTRARDELYLCQPMSQLTRDRDLRILVQSRFLAEIPNLGSLTERVDLVGQDAAGEYGAPF